MATGPIHKEHDSISATHGNIRRGDNINSCRVTRPFLFSWRLASPTYMYMGTLSGCPASAVSEWNITLERLQVHITGVWWCSVLLHGLIVMQVKNEFSILCLKSFLSDSCLVSMKMHYQHTVIRLSLLALPTYFILVSLVVRESTTSMSICSFVIYE